jgi:hypothetical protein
MELDQLFRVPGHDGFCREYEALRKMIRETGLNMIQWRNFNIDPDWYLRRMGILETGEIYGIRPMMEEIQAEFPNLKYGYFNPPKERMADFDSAFAH